MEIDKITGKIAEEELEMLAGEEATGGSMATAIISFVGVTVGVTLNAGACPTSACTMSCNE